MARSRTIVIAGAGIGGLTAALALTRAGFRAVVLEQAARLEETGAGIQLSPNATRVLFDLGLGERLRPLAVAPEAIRVVNGASGRDIVRVPLGLTAAQRYGAPYWVIHRADLQAVLAITIAESPDVMLRLGTRVDDFAVHQHGVTVEARGEANDARRDAWLRSQGFEVLRFWNNDVLRNGKGCQEVIAQVVGRRRALNCFK